MSDSVSEATKPAQSIVTGGIQWTLFALALPALLEQLLTFFVGFYDTYLSGQISAAATNAVGLATYVDWLGGMLFRLVGVGAAALVARHWGAGDIHEANRTTNRALAIVSVMGLLVSVMLYVAAPLFTDLLGMTGEARGIAIHYLHVDSLCYFFTGFTLVGGAILRASGDTRTPMLIYVIVSVFNVFAAYSFVYGLGPLPGMGVSGIVVGTVCARVFGGLLMVGGYARGFHGLRLSLRQWTLRGETVSRILRIGIPAAADGALAWIGIFLFLMLVSRGTSGVSDDVSLAAHVVGVRIEALTYLPADAWGFAAAAMVGQALGAGDPNRAKMRTRGRLSVQRTGPGDVGPVLRRSPAHLRLHAQQSAGGRSRHPRVQAAGRVPDSTRRGHSLRARPSRGRRYAISPVDQSVWDLCGPAAAGVSFRCAAQRRAVRRVDRNVLGPGSEGRHGVDAVRPRKVGQDRRLRAAAGARRRTGEMERKPPSESWESFTDRKIREAQEEGAFDALPGFGKPIPDLDGPDDPNWWVKKKLREERIVLLPPILEARLDAEKTLAAIDSMASEQQVRRTLLALNERIRQAHFSASDGPATGVRPVDVDAVVAEWLIRRAQRGIGDHPIQK